MKMSLAEKKMEKNLDNLAPSRKKQKIKDVKVSKYFLKSKLFYKSCSFVHPSIEQ